MATAVCGHIFCTSCLVSFIFNHHSDKCPICNVNISKSSDAQHSVAKMPSNVRIISKEEEIKRGIRRAEPGSTVPSLSQKASSKTVSKTAVKGPRPVPRKPGDDASDFEIKEYEQKLIWMDFNDGKVNFLKPDGSILTVAEYRPIASKVKANPEAYFQGEKFTFEGEDEEDVYIPETVVAEKEDKPVTKKISHKEETPFQNALKERRDIMKDFNDNKTYFKKPNGKILKIAEYREIAQAAKKDPESYYLGEMKEFKEIDEDGETVVKKVYIPEYTNQIPANPSDLLNKMKKNATKHVENDDETPSSPKASKGSKKTLDESEDDAPASPKAKTVSKKVVKASTSDDEDA